MMKTRDVEDNTKSMFIKISSSQRARLSVIGLVFVLIILVSLIHGDDENHKKVVRAAAVKAASQTELSAAKAIGNMFIKDVHSSNYQAAYQLTSPKFKAITGDNLDSITTIIQEINSSTSGQPEEISSAINVSKDPLIEFGYKVDSPKGLKEIVISLSRYNGAWLVNGINLYNSLVSI